MDLTNPRFCLGFPNLLRYPSYVSKLYIVEQTYVINKLTYLLNIDCLIFPWSLSHERPAGKARPVKAWSHYIHNHLKWFEHRKNPSPAVTSTPGNVQSRYTHHRSHIAIDWDGIFLCILRIPYLNISDFLWLRDVLLFCLLYIPLGTKKPEVIRYAGNYCFRILSTSLKTDKYTLIKQSDISHALEHKYHIPNSLH